MTLIDAIDAAIAHCGDCLLRLHNMVEGVEHASIGSAYLRRLAAGWGMRCGDNIPGSVDFERRARYDFATLAQLEVGRICGLLRRARTLVAINQTRQAVNLLRSDIPCLPLEVQTVIRAEDK